MRKLYTIEMVLLIYLILCIIGFSGGDSNFWKSFYFIREHGFIIALLIGPKNYFSTVFSKMLSWGVIGLKVELVIFNLVLVFLPNDLYAYYTNWYNAIIILSLSIWIIIFVCIFFDKLIIIINKCLNFYRHDRF